MTEPRERSSSDTLFLPHARASRARASSGGWTPPPDLRDQITRRLRLVALMYSAAFFVADFVSTALVGHLAERFRDPLDWIPSVASVVLGLAFAAWVSHPRLRWQTQLHLGLVFEVVSSWGIALAQYLGVAQFKDTPILYHAVSPSWVAVWMMAFTVIVPAPPRLALLTLLASAAAPPTVIALSLYPAGLMNLLPPGMLFLHHVFPYLIVTGMAYGASRIVYALGADVTRARELGSYRLVERLGQGGMGEVWRATHHLLAREAAIKFIRPEAVAGSSPVESRAVLKRFEMEARATASLSSAHTVDLYDYGVTEDGTFYYVMELLDGLDLDRLVRRFGAIPPARAVHLLVQVCESLEEAHEKGLIHRDVKPANVYACRAGTRCDFVKVLDFGLVAHQGPPPSPEARLTQPHHAIGTPEFMAPEVALGQDVDGRTDLYGVGCIAYWLVTGRSVFEGSGFFEVVSKHLHGDPDPPSRHAPHAIPPELDEAILACLAKDRHDRPDHARTLARMLRAVPFEEPWHDERAEAWWCEHLPASSAARNTSAQGSMSRVDSATI
jgi:serine/threonine-protein kinase